MISDFTLLLFFLLVATSSQMEVIISWGVGGSNLVFIRKQKTALSKCIRQTPLLAAQKLSVCPGAFMLP